MPASHRLGFFPSTSSIVVACVFLFATTSARAAEPAAEPAATVIARAQKLNADGKGAEGAAQLDAAIKAWKAIADKDTKNADASYQLAQLYLEYSRDAEAHAAIDQAIARDAKKPEYYKLRSLLFIYGNRGEEAAAALEKVVELDPHDVKSFEQLITIYSYLKQDAKTEALIERVLKAKPKETKLMLHMALLCRSRKDAAGAMKWIDRAAAIDPEANDLDMSRAHTLEMLGRNAEAYKIWKRLAADPKHAGGAEANTQKALATAAGLGKADDVETLRAKLIALHKEGKTTSPFFEREQFTHGKATILAEEYYELTGPQAIRYRFHVALDGKPAYAVTLGSYEFTNQIARQKGTIKADQRMFHLDWYGPEREHRTFAMFTSEPTYTDIRRAVGEIIDGKRQPQSSSKRGADGRLKLGLPDSTPNDKPGDAPADKPDAPKDPK